MLCQLAGSGPECSSLKAVPPHGRRSAAPTIVTRVVLAPGSRHALVEAPLLYFADKFLQRSDHLNVFHALSGFIPDSQFILSERVFLVPI